MDTRPTELSQIGPYRIVEKIGEGGMGVVYLGSAADGSLAAVKTLRPWLVGGEDGRRRFERELANLRRVRGTRIAEVLDADLGADRPYIVTRYVYGVPLTRLVLDNGPLGAPELDLLARGLLEALASVHAAGVVHRDVKPANVLVAQDGPVLIDFGIAHAAEDTRLTATGLIAGTPGYLAPETVLGKDPTPATDLHGWAATLAFAATGRPPFGLGPDVVVLDRLRRGEHDLHGIEAGLAALLAAALRVEPTERPGLAAALRALDGPGLAVTAARPPAPPTAGQPPVSRDGASRAGAVPLLDAVETAALPPVLADAVETAAFPVVAPTVAFPTAPPPPPPRPMPGQVAQPWPTPAPRQAPTYAPRQAPPTRAMPPPPGPAAQPGAAAKPARAWRSWVLIGLGALLLVLLNSGLPAVGAVVTLGVLFVGRVTWRVKRRLFERRTARGPNRNDSLMAAVALPWDLFASILPTLWRALFLLVCAGGVGIAIDVLDIGDVRTPYVGAALVATLLIWRGPGAVRFRHGLRGLVSPLDDAPVTAAVVIGLVAFVVCAVALLWDSFGTTWWPTDGPPEPSVPIFDE